MPLTPRELNDIDRAQRNQLNAYLDSLEEEEGDEEAAINRYFDEGDARLEEERDRRYRDEEET